MSNLFEVVFEDIPKNKVMPLLLSLIASSNRVINTRCSEDISFVDRDKISTSLLQYVLNFEGDISMLFDLQDMRTGSIDLPKVLLRLVKYEDKYDIDFNFNESEVDNKDIQSLIVELHGYAKKLAHDYEIQSFFGGLEPASDEETRYFTNELLRPLGS